MSKIDDRTERVLSDKTRLTDSVIALMATKKAKETNKMSEKTNGKTMMFPVQDLRDKEIHDTLSAVYEALSAKGYDPVNQLVGYFISEDPTYITNHNNARALIRKLDRDEVLSAMIKKYLSITD